MKAMEQGVGGYTEERAIEDRRRQLTREGAQRRKKHGVKRETILTSIKNRTCQTKNMASVPI